MNFVLWGLYQGALLCLYRLIEPYVERIEPARPLARRVFTVGCWFLFFHLVCYGWLLFRAESGAQILAMTANLVVGWSNLAAPLGLFARLVWFTWPLLVMQYFQVRKNNLLVALTWPWPVRAGMYVVLFYLVVIFGSIDGVQFIYFQF